MQFCLGVIPQTATGCHSNPIEFFLCTFLSQMYQFLSHYYAYHKMTTKYGILRLRPFQWYVFCQDYKNIYTVYGTATVKELSLL